MVHEHDVLVLALRGALEAAHAPVPRSVVEWFVGTIVDHSDILRGVTLSHKFHLQAALGAGDEWNLLDRFSTLCFLLASVCLHKVLLHLAFSFLRKGLRALIV